MAKFKRLLNYTEEMTHGRLRETCSRNGAAVNIKVGIKDVLPIEKSGIDDAYYEFALMAHFDFVVTDGDHNPLFVVEFDGPSHDTPVQAERDRKKNWLCDRFEMPLLRINMAYLHRTYRNLDLLTWIIQYWFGMRDIDAAYASGDIPEWEYLDPLMFLHIPGMDGRFPLWISADARIAMQTLWREGRCFEYVPATIVGQDGADTWRAFAAMRLTETTGVWTVSGMRQQRFPVPAYDMFEEILAVTIHDLVKDVLAGEEKAVTVAEIRSRAATFAVSLSDRSFHDRGWLADEAKE